MNNIYIYIPNEKKDYILKYGIKLSENSDTVITTTNGIKSGILGYLSPKDSKLYDNTNYSIIGIRIDDNINALVFNNICKTTIFFDDFICKFQDYNYGTYEEPLVLIHSSILPENIFLYDKLLSFPLLVENSKEYYYERAIHTILEDDKISKQELYQILLILGDKKNIFDVTVDNKLKIYKDKLSNKKYTKKNTF